MHLHFTASSAPLAQQALKEITAIIPNVPLSEADVKVVLSGDGRALEEMRNALSDGKPIYGLKCGTVGYLMNPLYSKYSLVERIKRATTVTFHPLNITATLRDRPEEIHMSSFNEGVVRRLSTQSAHIRVSCNLDGKKKELAELKHCDGCIVSTPLGSTGYWAAVGGRTIPWSKPVLGIHSICPSNKLKEIDDSGEVIIDALDAHKRPAIVSGDNQECRQPISSCHIAVDHQKKVQVLFDPMTLLKKRLSQYIR